MTSGLSIGYASLEAAGGNIALVRDGNAIAILVFSTDVSAEKPDREENLTLTVFERSATSICNINAIAK